MIPGLAVTFRRPGRPGTPRPDELAACAARHLGLDVTGHITHWDTLLADVHAGDVRVVVIWNLSDIFHDALEALVRLRQLVRAGALLICLRERVIYSRPEDPGAYWAVREYRSATNAGGNR